MRKNGNNNLRIGSASAFWGDSPEATQQLIQYGQLDYLVYDYLSEVTLALLARQKSKDPNAGYIDEFIATITPFLKDIEKNNIRIISNAGALNPQALVEKLNGIIQQLGLNLKVVAVTGDDLMSTKSQLISEKKLQFPSQTNPKSFLTCNAYLGAQPLVDALKAEAQIIICGRHVDSAHTLAPLIYHFSWSPTDYDRLSSGSLAGHLLECGAQSTGGNFTDWQKVPQADDIGYPIAICKENGEFIITKSSQSGGLVTPGTVAEQLVYEVADPQNYLLPDVTCDWSHVELTALSKDEVLVRGAKGQPPPSSLKVIATQFDSYRAEATIYIAGNDVLNKAKSIFKNIQTRVDRILAKQNLAKITHYNDEYIGSLNSPSPESCVEVLLRISVVSTDMQSLEVFAKEIAPAATNLAPGVCNLLGGRPQPRPKVQLISGQWFLKENSTPSSPQKTSIPLSKNTLQDWKHSIPLKSLALARSGDKGSDVNIGLIARTPEYLPYLRDNLDKKVIIDHLTKYIHGFKCSDISFYDWPGLNAINFVVHKTLSEGGLSHLSIDTQGKSYAQHLLSLEILIPQNIKNQVVP